MWRLEVTSPWLGDGSAANPFRPRLADDYPAAGWSDATMLPIEALIPTPNANNIVVRCDAATKDAIVADNRYVVWWQEEEEES